jgi:hypothetical protein
MFSSHTTHDEHVVEKQKKKAEWLVLIGSLGSLGSASVISHHY